MIAALFPNEQKTVISYSERSNQTWLERWESNTNLEETDTPGGGFRFGSDVSQVTEPPICQVKQGLMNVKVGCETVGIYGQVPEGPTVPVGGRILVGGKGKLIKGKRLC